MVDALQFIRRRAPHTCGEGTKPRLRVLRDCLAVCPVGAITNKYSKYIYKPWQLKKTTSTCAYCADGCQMSIETSGKAVQRVTSPLLEEQMGDRAETAKGHGGCACAAASVQYIDSKERLGMPWSARGGISAALLV